MNFVPQSMLREVRAGLKHLFPYPLLPRVVISKDFSTTAILWLIFRTLF